MECHGHTFLNMARLSMRHHGTAPAEPAHRLPRLCRLLDDIFSSYTWSFFRFGYLPSNATQRLRVASAVLSKQKIFKRSSRCQTIDSLRFGLLPNRITDAAQRESTC